MKFIITNKKELSKKIALNLKAIDKNTLISSLSNLKLDVEDSKLKITSYDGNNCVVTYTSIDNLDGENKTLLVDSTAFKAVIDKLASMSSEGILFEYLESTQELRLHSNKSRLKILTVADCSGFENLPTVEEFETFNSIVFSGNELIKSVDKVSKCSSKDLTRPELEAINFIVNNGTCEIVALDGYKIGLNVLECMSTKDFKLSLSASKLKSVLKDISLNGGFGFELKSNGKYTLIQSGDVCVFIRDMESKIAPYKKILSAPFEYEVIVNKKEFLNAVNATTMATSKDNKLVKLKLNIENSTIELNSKGDVISDFYDEVDVEYLKNNNGLNLEIAFNTSYLSDLISNIDSEKLVLFANESLSPVSIKPFDEKSEDVYLVLPVRLRN